MHRRSVVFGALAGAVSGFASAASPPAPSIVVWKDRNCGCCKDWITHLQKNGFQVQAHDTGNKAVRQRLGMPEEFGSCHTAQVGGYVIEGHVPAGDILRLLREKPTAIGLAVECPVAFLVSQKVDLTHLTDCNVGGDFRPA